MVYKIVITESANQDFDNIINYIMYTLNNAQAAISILDDYDNTKQRLSLIADGLKVRTDLSSKFQQIRTIQFKRHKYALVYTIQDESVIILGIFHGSQDIKTKIMTLAPLN